MVIGYGLYLIGVIFENPSLAAAGIPLEDMGLILMAVGVVLYFIISAARKAFK